MASEWLSIMADGKEGDSFVSVSDYSYNSEKDRSRSLLEVPEAVVPLRSILNRENGTEQQLRDRLLRQKIHVKEQKELSTRERETDALFSTPQKGVVAAPMTAHMLCLSPITPFPPDSKESNIKSQMSRSDMLAAAGGSSPIHRQMNISSVDLALKANGDGIGTVMSSLSKRSSEMSELPISDASLMDRSSLVSDLRQKNFWELETSSSSSFTGMQFRSNRPARKLSSSDDSEKTNSATSNKSHTSSALAADISDASDYDDRFEFGEESKTESVTVEEVQSEKENLSVEEIVLSSDDEHSEVHILQCSVSSDNQSGLDHSIEAVDAEVKDSVVNLGSSSDEKFLKGNAAEKTKVKVCLQQRRVSSPLVHQFMENMRGLKEEDLKVRLSKLTNLKFSLDLSVLPDGGRRICSQIRAIQNLIMEKSEAPNDLEIIEGLEITKKPTNDTKEVQVVEPPRFVAADYNRLLSNNPIHQRLFHGKMTDERMSAIKRIKGDLISRMHQVLTSMPQEGEETPTPKGLRTELKLHQKQGLTWMLWREKQSSPGGILADDMGLGKTLSMIALILQQKNSNTDSSFDEREVFKRRAVGSSSLTPSKATLVIAPASVAFQWESELRERVKPGRLNVYMFHGPKQRRESDPKRLARYDIVITTYNLVVSEMAEKAEVLGAGSEDDDNDRPYVKPKVAAKRAVSKNSSSVLARIAWERIVLDEAHQIKNKDSLTSKACCRLAGLARWCVTGTPIHNKLLDLYSLIRFMRIEPFCEEAMWKELITGRAEASAQRLNALVKGILLRRTKEQNCPTTDKPILDLKPKKFETIKLRLEGLEKKIYDVLFIASRQKVKEFIKSQAEKDADTYGYGCSRRHHAVTTDSGVMTRNPFVGGVRTINTSDKFQGMSCVLTMLLRLRQACAHLSLTKSGIDVDAFETAGFGNVDSQEERLAREMANMSVVDEEQIAAELIDDNVREKVQDLFEPSYKSAKIRAFLRLLDEALDSGDKCVVVSQWTSLLDIVEMHLKERLIRYTSISGRVPTKDRQPRVDSFNEVGSGARVMLLSLTAGGVGLNLVGGNHLFLLDLHWNPAIEQQACDRIYRMGQEKSVFIHKFICLETIEERVQALQEGKKTLAKGVLEGAASKNMSKLTIADLKYLFDLDGRQTINPVPELVNVRPVVPSFASNFQRTCSDGRPGTRNFYKPLE